MTDTKPTIDEQIAYQQNTVKIIEDFDDQDSLPKEKAILASLERLKAIDSVRVPEEPPTDRRVNADLLDYIDTLRDLLKKVTAERDACAQMNDDQAQRVYAAEAKLAAIEKMGREPSEGMVEAGYAATNQDDRYCVEDCDDAKGLFTAMFNKMMEELK